jgi:large subunit ribosomal protein L23Ae
MKPITTEKAIMRIESQNTLTFTTERKKKKPEIIKEIEEIFDVKVKKIRTQIRNNSKYVYVQLKKEFPAIDISTKLGFI